MEKSRRRKRRKSVVIVVVFLMMILLVWKSKGHDKQKSIEDIENNVKGKVENTVAEKEPILEEEQKTEIVDWRLVLVNQENALPSDFGIELTKIDRIREFDVRAIGELNQMIDAMKKDGITNVWVQSAYRSVEHQKELFEHRIREYETLGKTREEAEKIVLQTLNKPGTSEHNLGLAVDFNYVDYSFDETAGFKWLKENAEKYGFILRYEKDKEPITKVDYEPWHWRFVGREHAVKMNELGMCLEEYLEYLTDKN